MKASEVYDDVFEEIAADARPENPPSPEKGRRMTYLLTFDNGHGDTEGMLDRIREAGLHAISTGRLPRTTIICRTGVGVPSRTLLDVVSGALLSNGSAIVSLMGSSDAWVWPDRAWKKGQEKAWAKVVP